MIVYSSISFVFYTLYKEVTRIADRVGKDAITFNRFDLGRIPQNSQRDSKNKLMGVIIEQ